ncbi:hypothetical protein OPV22_031049 [Ensete ventricosum]|uniref:Alpha-L-fucosidase n=1 Tax=Ensete ventricosum TaxID=4639 RepID=A0AAV8PNC2_ENSVE|nr:hypothetical protein OPV22_031049 [Ensete ventricosum]
MASHHILLLLLTSVLLLETSASPSPCAFPAIFNFGDSNSDTGGLSAAFGPAPPPHGETFFGAPAGRYCDGRLIVDFIAQGLGLPFLSAYLDSVATNFSHGANFATAGSTIRRQNTTLFQTGYSPFSLDVQSWQFAQFKSRSQIAYKKGDFRDELPPENYFSKALYTFDVGQNDLTSGYVSNMTTDEVKATIPDILDKFTVVIKGVYGLGGRFFWIHNTGPFGCLPYVLDRFPIRAPEVDRVDKHGFEHPLVACCGHGGKYNYNIHWGCGSKTIVNGTEVLVGKACQHPLKRICWDGVHYTEAANKWVYDQIVEGALSDPPIPLRMACQRQNQ